MGWPRTVPDSESTVLGQFLTQYRIDVTIGFRKTSE